MDPKKAAAEWFRSTIFRDELIRPKAPRRTERIPSLLSAARSLENGAHQIWQSRETVFMKQGKLLANYEDDYDYRDSTTCYYPTYQALTNQQLRGYFSWRTKLRKGDVRETSLSFAFLYIYELINQIGVTDPVDGYRKLENFRDAYGPIDGHILPYLSQWLTDYVVYYGLDPALLSDSPPVLFDRSVAVLEHIREREPVEVIRAVRQLSPSWLGRSRFYADHPEEMDIVIDRVLRRVSDHYAARCKRSMVDQYFGGYSENWTRPFDAAVFCDPLNRRDYEYAVSEQRIYRCMDGYWYVWARACPTGAKGKLDALLKTVDSVMRREFRYRYPVKPEMDAKWVLRIIQEEVSGVLAEKKGAEKQKITIHYGQLTQIRRDAAATQEKLVVEEETDLPEEPAPREEPDRPAPAAPPEGASDTALLSSEEYRLLQCLLYGGDTGWVQAEGHLLSVLVDGINEKLYDTFLDCVLDGAPQVVEDYIEDLKEMVHL